MKQIILLTEFFPPHHGGVEQSCLSIAQRWGSDALVVAPPQPGDHEFDQTQTYRIVRRSLFSGRFKPSWMWLMPWLMKQAPTYVLFGHFSSAVSAASLLKPFGVRYAVLVHGNDLLTEQRRWFQGWLVRHQLRRAEWIGVNSQFVFERVQKLGVARSRIIFTHPSVTPAKASPPPTHSDQVHVITICRLVARKNVARVVEAIGHIHRDFPNLVYDIVGDGPEHLALSKLISNLQLQDVVRLHGSVDDEKKQQLLNQASIAIMAPTVLDQGVDVEGLGLFYLEAAQRGLPLIASQTGGVGDIVKNNVTGLTVDPHSVSAIAGALRTILSNADLRQTLGQAAQTLVQEEFTTTVRVGRAVKMIERQSQSNAPLVSIVIPAFQSARTIASTLESALAQTWPKIEIIVVDDGSTDGLEQAVQPFADRVRLVRQTNQGAPSARNNGAAKASGEFLLFLDADTVLEPSAITTMVVTLQTHPQATYTYSNFRSGPKDFRLFEFSAEKLRRQNYIHTSSLIRRQDFPGFDPSLKRFQDWDLWLTLLADKKTGIWIPQKLFLVMEHAGGMSRWVPSFVYRLPLIGQGIGNSNIARYREAERIIRRKHSL